MGLQSKSRAALVGQQVLESGRDNKDHIPGEAR